MNLHVPIYSMRSYETGLYDVSKDGNFQLHLSRMQSDDLILVPYNSIGIETFIETGYLKKEQVVIMNCYGSNAYETRKLFVSNILLGAAVEFRTLQHLKLNCIRGNLDAIVTDITGFHGAKDVFFNFNITKDPNNPKYYIDEFIESDLKSIERSIFTTVLNQNQKDYLVSLGANPDKIKVCHKVINRSLLSLYENDPGFKEQPIDGIFFPFRLTDSCYKFDEAIKYASLYNLNLYVTDPNQSLSDDTLLQNCTIVKLDNVTKTSFYSILKSRPKVCYYENPSRCYHPGLAELIHYNIEFISRYVDDIKQITDIYVTDKIYTKSNI